MTTEGKVARRKRSRPELAAKMNNISGYGRLCDFRASNSTRPGATARSMGPRAQCAAEPGCVIRLRNEHFRIMGRKLRYESGRRSGDYPVAYKTKRPHPGRNMKGRPPFQTVSDGMKD